jgi:hypothetical protein
MPRLTDDELAEAFRSRNLWECFTSCVEMSIEDIIKELRRIEAGEPRPENPHTDPFEADDATTNRQDHAR